MRVLSLTLACAALISWANPGIAFQSSPESEPESAEAAEVQTTEQAKPESETETVLSATEANDEQAEEVPIMDVPLDGSSIETFTAGLEELDKNASEGDYRRVMSALDYLLFYDIRAKRDKAKLYSRLNGMSPNQILEKVNSSRSK